jgi:hypothetical protein
VRAHVLIPLLAFGCIAHADRLISIPTARKLPFGTVSFEGMSEVRGRTVEHYLDVGIGTSFELEAHSQRWLSGPTVGTFDVDYSYLAPIPDLAPGISLGVQDALDRTVQRRRYYAAITFRNIFETSDGEVPADITLGAFLGHQSGAFVGVALPFSKAVWLLAEHDGYRISSGLELRPTAWASARLIFRDQQTLFDLKLVHRF